MINSEETSIDYGNDNMIILAVDIDFSFGGGDVYLILRNYSEIATNKMTVHLNNKYFSPQEAIENIDKIISVFQKSKEKLTELIEE